MKKTFTLIEIVISMAILSIIGLIIVTFTENGYNVFRNSQSLSVGVSESDALTSRLANALRGGFQVISATPSSITALSYYAPSDQTPTEVSISQSESQLILSTISGVASVGGGYSYDPTTAITKTIATNFDVNANVPLFQYYNENEVLLTSPIDINAIHLIHITVTVQSPTINKILSSETDVELRNLKTNL